MLREMVPIPGVMSTPTIRLDATATLVPLVRFGAALHRRRTRRGEALAALARQSVTWLPDQLLQIELGQIPLTDDDVVALAVLYQLSGKPVPRGDRIDLVLDRTTSVEVADPFGHSAADDPEGGSVDGALRRFLALAVLLGPLDRVPLRLSAASEALDVEIDQLVRRADRLARDDSATIWSLGRDLGRRVVVPEAGVRVAETYQGTLVIISRADRRTRRRTNRAAGPLSELLGPGDATSRSNAAVVDC